MKLSLNLTQLYSRALIPSIAQHPAWLEPMFNELGAQHDGAVIVEVSDQTANADELIAVAAMQRLGISSGYMFPVAATWDCGFLFSGLPLLDANDPERALLGLVKAAKDKTKAEAVLFRKVPAEGPFADVIQYLVSEGRLSAHYFDVHERAMLKTASSFDTWFKENISSKRRKEYRRLRKRLECRGVVEVTAWQTGDAVEQWVEDFLVLEAAGWKGRRGTAINCSAAQTGFFRLAMNEMAAAEKLLFWRISLSGKPIAMLFALGSVDDGQISLGKMAYDEHLSQYSPGVMVILEVTRCLLDKGFEVSVDSAADSEHPMIDNIWRSRLKICDVMLSAPDASQIPFGVLVQAEKIRRALRGLAKRIYNTIRRRR
jgi:CelD/BcsL family acetyltransferase involved in cellulose biosynthesis